MNSFFNYVLDFKELSVGYTSIHPILSGLNQGVRVGEFVVLLGPNGVGKTTLLRTLAGLQVPLAGEVYLNGHPISRLKPVDIARCLSVVLTEYPVPDFFTALELVCLGRIPHSKILGRFASKDRQKAILALEMVGASPLAQRLFSKLSDGERQKVMLARALAQEPNIIILDEPTLHLDIRHRLDIIVLLRRLCREQGIAVLASLHDLDLTMRLADTVGLLSQKGLKAWGSPEKVLTSDRLEEIYGLDRAIFSPDLGTIEIKFETFRGLLFVVSGGGTGVKILRSLAKMGFGLRVGVLHQHDLDCRVALSLGAKVITQPPFQDVDSEAISIAIDFLSDCFAVIDTAFPIGRENLANLELFKKAAEMGLPILSLRDPQAMATLFNGIVADYTCFFHLDYLLERLL